MIINSEFFICCYLFFALILQNYIIFYKETNGDKFSKVFAGMSGNNYLCCIEINLFVGSYGGNNAIQNQGIYLFIAIAFLLGSVNILYNVQFYILWILVTVVFCPDGLCRFCQSGKAKLEISGASFGWSGISCNSLFGFPGRGD